MERIPEATRLARVRQLWQARPPEEPRDATGVLIFYDWLGKHHPELLPSTREKGDPYQHLQVDLEDLIQHDEPPQ